MHTTIAYLDRCSAKAQCASDTPKAPTTTPHTTPHTCTDTAPPASLAYIARMDTRRAVRREMIIARLAGEGSPIRRHLTPREREDKRRIALWNA